VLLNFSFNWNHDCENDSARLQHPLALQYFFVAKEKTGVGLVKLSVLSILGRTSRFNVHS